MYKIRKLFEFEMSHILDSCVSEECQRIHGHSYKLEVEIWSANLNKDGMVLDFKVLKQIVKDQIISKFDHKMAVNSSGKWAVEFGHLQKSIIWVDYNPTAENMAKDFHTKLWFLLTKIVPGLNAIVVRLYETRTGWAEYS